MLNLKKILPAAICAASVLALSACGDDAPKPQPKKAEEAVAESSTSLLDSAKDAGSSAMDTVKEVSSDAVESAKKAGAEAMEAGADAMDSAKEVGADAVDSVKESGADLMDASSLMDSSKDKANEAKAKAKDFLSEG